MSVKLDSQFSTLGLRCLLLLYFVALTSQTQAVDPQDGHCHSRDNIHFPKTGEDHMSSESDCLVPEPQSSSTQSPDLDPIPVPGSPVPVSDLESSSTSSPDTATESYESTSEENSTQQVPEENLTQQIPEENSTQQIPEENSELPPMVTPDLSHSHSHDSSLEDHHHPESVESDSSVVEEDDLDDQASSKSDYLVPEPQFSSTQSPNLEPISVPVTPVSDLESLSTSSPDNDTDSYDSTSEENLTEQIPPGSSELPPLVTPDLSHSHSHDSSLEGHHHHRPESLESDSSVVEDDLDDHVSSKSESLVPEPQSSSTQSLNLDQIPVPVFPVSETESLSTSSPDNDTESYDSTSEENSTQEIPQVSSELPPLVTPEPLVTPDFSHSHDSGLEDHHHTESLESDVSIVEDDLDDHASSKSDSLVSESQSSLTQSSNLDQIPVPGFPVSETESLSTSSPDTDTESYDSASEENSTEQDPQESSELPPLVTPDLSHSHSYESGHEDHHHDHHHHHHPESPESDSSAVEDDGAPAEHIHKESSPFIAVVKHLSYSLLFFLPEHLQDSILDVNDALILTGIIALALVSVCVPYFFIETYMAVRPLKKKVVELNRNLWKVSTAYENQQEDFDAYKKKALAYDEDKVRIEKLETELHLVKQLDGKHQDLIKKLQKDLRYSSKVATEVEGLVDKTMKERDTTNEELEKMKGYLMNVQLKYKLANESLEASKTDAVKLAEEIEVLTHSNDMNERNVKKLEKEVTDYKALLHVEGEKRRTFENDADKYLAERDSLQKELTDLKTILHQYEETVSSLSQEVSLKENELMLLRENLGDDSPLVEAAELSAKLNVAQGNASALQLRVDSLTLEHRSLSQNLEKITSSAKKLESEKEHAENKLQVLESYFKEKEEELRTMVEKYESEKLTRGMDKEGLISRIEEKEDDIRELNRRIEAMKEELENTKLAHRNEFRAMEAKEHEHWLLLCQSERKLQEARKESETLRQKLTALSREKEADGLEEVDGDLKMNYFSMISSDLIPAPLPDDIGPTYIGLNHNFIPPPPLDDEDDDDDDDLDSPSRDREPLRQPPLGGRQSPNFSENGHDDPLSPIDPRGYDYSTRSYSPDRRPPSRESWINGNDRGSEHRRYNRDQPRTSSPINHGVNV